MLIKRGRMDLDKEEKRNYESKREIIQEFCCDYCLYNDDGYCCGVIPIDKHGKCEEFRHV